MRDEYRWLRANAGKLPRQAFALALWADVCWEADCLGEAAKAAADEWRARRAEGHGREVDETR